MIEQYLSNCNTFIIESGSHPSIHTSGKHHLTIPYSNFNFVFVCIQPLESTTLSQTNKSRKET
jgi:hypothetical protein